MVIQIKLPAPLDDYNSWLLCWEELKVGVILLQRGCSGCDCGSDCDCGRGWGWGCDWLVVDAGCETSVMEPAVQRGCFRLIVIWKKTKQNKKVFEHLLLGCKDVQISMKLCMQTYVLQT